MVHMEIVDIDHMSEGNTQRLVDEIGEILGSDPGHTWLCVIPVAGSHYAENLRPSAAVNHRPVFVTIEREGRSRNMRAEARGIAAAVAAILGRKAENVHVKYAEPLAGRMAYGGDLGGRAKGQ